MAQQHEIMEFPLHLNIKEKRANKVVNLYRKVGDLRRDEKTIYPDINSAIKFMQMKMDNKGILKFKVY